MIRKKQPRKNISNNTRLILLKPSDDNNTKPPGINLLQISGLLVSLTGIIGAFFWILGRFYYGRMFEYYGAPITPALPNESYLEIGAFFFWGLISDTLMFVLVYSFAHLIWKEFEILLEKTKKHNRHKLLLLTIYIICFGGAYILYYTGKIRLENSFTGYVPNVFIVLLISIGLHATKYMFIDYKSMIAENLGLAYLLIAGLIVLSTHLGVAYKRGYITTCQTTLNKPIFITLYSDKLLITKRQNLQQGLFIYEDYSLLFMDKENYYLSEKIDQESNQPEGFAIIRKDEITATEIITNNVADDKKQENRAVCEKKALDLLPTLSLQSSK